MTQFMVHILFRLIPIIQVCLHIFCESVFLPDLFFSNFYFLAISFSLFLSPYTRAHTHTHTHSLSLSLSESDVGMFDGPLF